MCHQLKTPSRSRTPFRTVYRKECGAELLEVALTIPILLALLLGILSFTRAYNAYQTITRAAREGARTLVLTTCATCGNASVQSSTARSVVNGVLTSANFTPSNVTNYAATYVWIDASAATPQQCGVNISFNYPYQILLPFTSVNLTNLNLKADVQMRMENQPTTCVVGGSVP
jgi:Flp pilus assembly protein TadG